MTLFLKKTLNRPTRQACSKFCRLNSRGSEKGPAITSTPVLKALVNIPQRGRSTKSMKTVRMR